MQLDQKAFADMVIRAVEIALGPIREQLAATEARLASIGDLRDRVVTMEAKAAQPVSPPAPDLDMRDRLVVLETKWSNLPTIVVEVQGQLAAMMLQAGDMRERLAVLETRAPVPGPAGQNGIDGKDGADGLGFDDVEEAIEDGGRVIVKTYRAGDRVKVFRHQTATQINRGVYVDGKAYERGDVVTWGGSQWTANEDTATKPGDGLKAWTLTVKRGRDGKDGRDGRDLAPVVKVG